MRIFSFDDNPDVGYAGFCEAEWCADCERFFEDGDQVCISRDAPQPRLVCHPACPQKRAAFDTKIDRAAS